MTPELAIVAKLIALDMQTAASSGTDLRTYAGMGCALQRVYEVATGNDGANLSGLEIVRWAESVKVLGPWERGE